nr:hypothetical protein [Rodent Torque teno virus 4]
MSPTSSMVRRKKARAIIRRERARRVQQLRDGVGNRDGGDGSETTPAKKAKATGAAPPRTDDSWFKKTYDGRPFWELPEIRFNLTPPKSSDTEFSSLGDINDLFAPSTDSDSSECWDLSPIKLPQPGFDVCI